MAGVGLLFVGDVDPVKEMLSDAIQTLPGALLLMVAASGLAVSGLWLLAGVRRVLPRAGVVSWMLAVWCVSLVAVAFCPTNLPGTEPGLVAVVHRVGAGLMAALPPLIALIVAEKAGRVGETGRVRRLRAAGLAALAACVAFGVAHGPTVLFGSELFPYAGLAERILLALVLVVVGLCAWVLDGVNQPGSTSGEGSVMSPGSTERTSVVMSEAGSAGVRVWEGEP
ncbi:DUF998 domain-containing protein [Actinoplanes sp. Pm04-4]|uniref:DUF998 domain-containing protein n=1 Tax=Paractinoplanes pyxinae TaxID=2997416 RepID=A0ABT4BCK9_9ACTN|nr:DUF998 domain-containing protein [Actinoplanes pyxinae]MCY1144254.1 DUF998 domain-containing protein [Actinoplanes pyxinae]